MKNFIQFSLVILFVQWGVAQQTTPNTGETYTLSDLYLIMPFVVSGQGPDQFSLSSDLTIAENDVLLITGSETLRIGADVLLTVEGELHTDGNATDDLVTITADMPTLPFEGIRIEEGASATFNNTKIEYGGGLKVLTTDFTMTHCIVEHQVAGAATGGALSFSRGRPIVDNTTFYMNDMPAIATGANQTVAVQITNCTFEMNAQSNENRPQINLSASGEDDYILIENNEIIGDRSKEMVGGIAIANFYSLPNNVLISNNTIRDNRYGITLYGSNDSALIDGNIIEDNNTQNDPMQGGSGINLYAQGDEINTNTIIQHNQIRRNLWGITLQGNAFANLGDESEDSPGGNVFAENGNNGMIYALYNNTPNNLMARHNCWIEGVDYTEQDIEDVIYHAVDDAELGLVDFLNSYCNLGVPVEVDEASIRYYPNPSDNQLYINTTELGEVTIYTATGKLMRQIKLDLGLNQINHNLSSGIYILCIQVGNHITRDKLIVK